MKKDKENTKVTKPDRKKLKITISVLILAALFTVELYLMINRPEDLLLLGVITLVMLCFVYWIVDLTFKLRNEKEDKRDKEYETLYKSQKISYMLMKENFEDLYVSLQDIGDNSEIPVDDLIQAQKAIAKVTINRSKENANALMNSNDKLIEKMHMFEETLKNMETAVENNKVTGLDEMADRLAKRQQEIMSSVDGVEYTLKNDIKQVVEGLQQQIATMPSGANASVQDTTQELMSEEDLDALLKEIDTMTEVTGDTSVETPVEDILHELQEVTDEGDFAEDVLEDIPEDIMMDAPEVLEKNELEEIDKSLTDDPNHVMTPDEIAALFGSVNEDAEPAPEPEPEAEKPPMPDLSDPNHVMTPDEIAALLANM